MTVAQLPRRAAWALLLVTSAACSAWRPRPLPVPGATAPGPVRVVLVDGRRVVLARVAVEGNSLTGDEGCPPQRRAVALHDVARVEGREASAVRTLGAGWLAINAATVVALFVYLGYLRPTA